MFFPPLQSSRNYQFQVISWNSIALSLSLQIKVRVVRCPRCENLLPEPSGLPVYQCGGCGTVLRAKSKVLLNEKRDFGSSKKYEYLSEQGGSSLGGVSDSEWDSPSMEPTVKERVLRSRRTVFSNSPIRTNDREDIDDYERKIGKETKGVWPMQRLGDKEVGLVEETHSQFSEQRIENWVRRYNIEQDVNIYDSDSPSTAPYRNPLGAARTRATFEHHRVERDAFAGYSGNSMAVAHGKGAPNFRDPRDRPSSSNLDLFYGHPEHNRNYEGPIEGLDPNRAELLRRLDELKDQIIKSCDVGDRPRVVADRASVDPYYARSTYNIPMRYSTKSPQHIHSPQYFDRGNGTFPASGHHQRNDEDFLHPPRHVVKDIPLYEDQFQEQMIRKPNYPPTHQYPPRLPRECYPESFMDLKQDPLSPSHGEDAFFHHPACSCSQCSKRNKQGPPLQAPNSAISNVSNPKEPIKSSTYDNENPVTVGLNASNLTHAGRYPSQDTLPHSRQPSELDSEIDGFGLVQPRVAAVLQRNGKSCDAIAGGAPFIVCTSCLELLKLPRKLYKLEMDWQKLQCGACSVVIIVKVENRKLVVSVSAETKPEEVSPDDGSPKRVVDATSSLESSDNSSHKVISTDHDKSSDDRDSNRGEFKTLELTSSLISSEEKETSIVNCDLKNVSDSADLPSKDTSSVTSSTENSDNPSDNEPSKYKEGSENKQNILVDDVTEPNELDVSFEDYSNSHVSQDSVEINKEEKGEEDQSKIKSNQESESFFVGLSRNNLRDFSRSSEITDNGRPTVSVNGQHLPAYVVKKAEKKAGPILPGDYWYDYQAGFWGVMGHPCLGIIPPFIDEFTYPMSRNCAAGNTGIFVNGRELHKRDLELLSSRGLPTTANKLYRIDISGRVVDEDSGKELFNLGKLAPTQ
ncbi:protein ENHANCED DISEASE RESISTANCE 4-like isoform X2 [Benincasa hispida]|uniref:protein ENHANCED DISEASE RESISTANCE 4-like isoform X2 n=1 Tax=Benincasa hispida TaxID=102211 RepID=UPI001901A21E|nr:protein ENHANCED DISEASE RESISTANCE 4-like isoform X2 [Benincasa hispida]